MSTSPPTKDCECTLLSLSEKSQLSPWSDFLDTNTNGFDTKSSCSNITKRSRTNQPFKSSGKQTVQFEHHESYHSYIEDYRKLYQKCAKSQKIGFQKAATPYNMTCSLNLPTSTKV